MEEKSFHATRFEGICFQVLSVPTGWSIVSWQLLLWLIGRFKEEFFFDEELKISVFDMENSCNERQDEACSAAAAESYVTERRSA